MAAPKHVALGVGACMIGIALFHRHFSKKHRSHASSKSRKWKSHPQSATWDSNWDYRSPFEEDGPRPRASRHILLVRHGQFVWKGQIDSGNGLTEVGLEQSDVVGKRLKALQPAGNYTAIHQSSMRRSMETCNIIKQYLPDVPVKTDEILNEGFPVAPDPYLAHWTPTIPKHKFFQDGARIEAAFRKYFYRAPPEQENDSYEIIVGHSNVIRYFVCRSLQMAPDAWRRFSHANCGITRVTIRPNGRVSLKSFADVGHLPDNLITYS